MSINFVSDAPEVHYKSELIINQQQAQNPALNYHTSYTLWVYTAVSAKDAGNDL